jgi:hypothetical protein
MKRWVIAVLFSTVTSCPGVSVAADSTFDSGRATRFTIPLLEIPFGSSRDSGAVKKKDDAPKMEEKDKEAKRKEQEKAAIDKKVDDAIKKAWGREPTESPDPPK